MRKSSVSDKNRDLDNEYRDLDNEYRDLDNDRTYATGTSNGAAAPRRAPKN